MFNRTMLAMALSLGCLVGGYTLPALAAAGNGGNFSVDQSCGIPGAGSPCSETGGTLTGVDTVTHTYVATVNQMQAGPVFLDGDDPFVEKGFTTWTGYTDDSGNTIPGQTTDYKVIGIFSATGTAGLVSGGFIDATFKTFTITFYMNDSGTASCTAPADPNTGSVTCSGSLVPIGTATLIPGDNAQARLFPGFALGDFRIEMSNFALTAFGKTFLTDPTLFYQLLTLTGVTTSVSGASGTHPFIARLSGQGGIFFRTPEPGSLGMLGLGLLAVGLGIRYRRVPRDTQ